MGTAAPITPMVRAISTPTTTATMSTIPPCTILLRLPPAAARGHAMESPENRAATAAGARAARVVVEAGARAARVALATTTPPPAPQAPAGTTTTTARDIAR